jgi:hypothetical protein
MNIAVRAAPPPGSAQAGDLYVDLQSRTLWLGVDPSVDPAQFVLISDIVALQNQIVAGDNTGKAYTDTQIATRAPTVHTHTSTQITDFNAAVTAVASSIPALQWVRGMIMAYSGLLTDIGIGALAGWHLCDGSSGTPDLRERFILGAGSRAAGSTNPYGTVNTGWGGAHGHNVNYTTLTTNEMPYHNHGGATPSENAFHYHYVNLLSSTETADHAHYTHFTSIGTGQGTGPGADIAASGYGSTGYDALSGGRNAAHQHYVQGYSSEQSAFHQHGIYAEGGQQGHTHTLADVGYHWHEITTANLREAIPFYALAFIMKT